MLVHFEFGIRELVMNNASALRASSRPAGDRIRAGQTEVPGGGERGGWSYPGLKRETTMTVTPVRLSSGCLAQPPAVVRSSRMTISRSNDSGNGDTGRFGVSTTKIPLRCLPNDE